jgi:tetratricopeptide (TPR) repeat protein
LHQAGREAGAAGDYENAFALFSQAAALAPGWPYPVYDEAFTHLLMGDFAAALEDYRRTIALAPRGFFTARTAVDVLEREEAGELPVGIYLAYSQVGWIQDPTAKEARLRELLARAPAFAPGWKELATLLEDGAARLDAIERGLAAHPDPETRGILLIRATAMRRLRFSARLRSMRKVPRALLNKRRRRWRCCLTKRRGSDQVNA